MTVISAQFKEQGQVQDWGVNVGRLLFTPKAPPKASPNAMHTPQHKEQVAAKERKGKVPKLHRQHFFGPWKKLPAAELISKGQKSRGKWTPFPWRPNLRRGVVVVFWPFV